MKNLKRVIARFGFIAAMLVVLGVTATVPVAADTINASGTLSGAFSGSSSGSLTFGITVNGTAQSATNNGATLNAADFSGNSAGWNIQVNPAQFSTGGGTPKTLSTTALSVNSVPAATCAAGTTCGTAPDDSAITYPIALTAGSASKIYSAANGTGDGSWDVIPVFKLSVAATDKAGAYSSTLTVSYTAGP